MKPIKKIVLAFILLSFAVSLPSLLPYHNVFGKMLQPMHTPVLLAGFIVGGPMAMVVGAAAPLLRHWAIGMPEMSVALPMCLELAVYGLVTGMVYKASHHRGRSIVKSLIAAMIAGRCMWGIANWAVNGYTFEMIMMEGFFNAIPGIIIQLLVVPLIIYGLKKTQQETIKK